MSKDTSFDLAERKRSWRRCALLWTTVKQVVSPRPSISRRSLLRSDGTESGN